MFWVKKKKENQQQDNVVNITKEENTVIEIHSINNRTGTEYVYRSENEFGLDWATVDGWLHIWQCLSKEDDHGIAIAALVDFSIVKVIRNDKKEGGNNE
jgi:hypothetical protein